MASSSTCPGSSSVSLTVLADSPHQPKSMIFLVREINAVKQLHLILILYAYMNLAGE